MGNPDDAADGLQDGLIAAYRRAGSFRGDAAVTTWLHRVVVNACLDRLRAAKVRRADPLPDDLEDYGDRGSLGHLAPAAADDPADLRSPPSAGAAVLAALATLPADQRAALVLVDMEGYPVAEVAAMLDCAEGTVKSRCSRGRARLAALLGDLRPVTADDPRRGTPARRRRPTARPPGPAARPRRAPDPHDHRPTARRPRGGAPMTDETDDQPARAASERYAASSPTPATPSRCPPTWRPGSTACSPSLGRGQRRPADRVLPADAPPTRRRRRRPASRRSPADAAASARPRVVGRSPRSASAASSTPGTGRRPARRAAPAPSAAEADRVAAEDAPGHGPQPGRRRPPARRASPRGRGEGRRLRRRRPSSARSPACRRARGCSPADAGVYRAAPGDWPTPAASCAASRRRGTVRAAPIGGAPAVLVCRTWPASGDPGRRPDGVLRLRPLRSVALPAP